MRVITYEFAGEIVEERMKSRLTQSCGSSIFSF